MSNVGCFNYCVANLLQPTLQGMVNNGYMAQQYVPAVSNSFMQDGVNFDHSIAKQIGPQVDTDLLGKILRKVLLDKYCALLRIHPPETFPNYKQIIDGGMAFNNTVMAPVVNYGNISLANDPNLLEQQRSQLASSMMSSGGVGSVMDSHVVASAEVAKMPTPEAPPPAPPAYKFLDDSSRVVPREPDGVYPIYAPYGVVVTVISNDDGKEKNTNQRILLRKSGMTAQRINGDIYTIDGRGIEITDQDEKVTQCILDYIQMKADKVNPVCFESDQDLFDYFQNNLSSSDTVTPYFRAIEYGFLTAIPVEHDLFFSEIGLLQGELRKQYTKFPNDIFQSNDMVMRMLELVDVRDRTFKRGFLDYLLKKVNHWLDSTMRIAKNPATRVTLTDLTEIAELVDKNFPLASFRDHQQFNVALKYLHRYCLDFAMGMNADAVPFPINTDPKGHMIDPYIKTRKYMAYLEARPGISTMDYWKHKDEPEVMHELIRTLKKKTLVIENKITAITNVYAPGVLKSLADGITKGRVIVPNDVRVDANKSVSLKYADDKLYVMLNEMKSILKNKIPDNLLYLRNQAGSGGFVEFQVTNTLDNIMILER